MLDLSYEMFDPATGQTIQEPNTLAAAPPLPPMQTTTKTFGAAQAGLLREPKNLVRLVAWFTSMIAFSTAAHASGTDEATALKALGYKWSTYEFIQAANIMLWLWSMLIIADTALGLRQKKPGLPWGKVQFAVDAVLTFFVFIAFIAGAAELNKSVCTTTSCMDMWDFCKFAKNRGSDITCPAHELAAGVAFSFFATVAMSGATLFSFKDFKGTQGASLPPVPPAQGAPGGTV